MDCIHSVKNGKYVLSTYHDEDPISPRDHCNLGTIVYGGSKYILGDQKAENTELYSSWDEWHDNELGDDVISLPVYAYIHSGITISTGPFNCPWDSGQAGYIYVHKEDVRSIYGVKRISKKLRDNILETLEHEIKIYDRYLQGDVYGYMLEEIYHCECCNNEDTEVIDSCWGFFGYEDMIDMLHMMVPQEHRALVSLIKEEC